jgi:hypothetical protein
MFQMLNAHECFYAHRANTEFIALIDWDDLLLPSPQFASLNEALQAGAAQFPASAYFLVNKLESSYVEHGITQSLCLNPEPCTGYNRRGVAIAIASLLIEFSLFL